MSANLVPFSSAGGFSTVGNVTSGNLITTGSGGDITMSGGNITGAGNISLDGGYIVGGTATVVTDGINSIALAPGATMDVFGFPFTAGPARGQLTITGITTPSEANGTWYYQSFNNNYTYQIYTDSTYSTLVDASGWSAYTGGGSVAITLQDPRANIVVDSNGYFSTFDNTGNLTLPGSLNSAANLKITANTQSWTFGTDGVATLPGEGILRSIDDTVTLQSFNTSTGNANSVYLGTSGGLGFSDGEIGGNWLEIFRNGTEPEIRVPVGLGNLNIQTASGNTLYNWTFDDTGNLTLPANTFAVNYANGTAVSLGGGSSYGNANVATFLAGFGSNTVSTTGNITSGNILTSGLISATGNVQSGNIRTAGLISATSNVTGGNILTGGLISATGNITAQNFIGNISITGNVTGTSANVTLVAGSYSWIFDNTGNLTIPATGDILLANTQSTISAAGNVTAGNILVGGATNISNVTINSYTSVPQLWFKGTLSTDQSLTTSNDTIILYNTNTDPLSWGNVSNGHVTPTKSGWYEVVSRVQFSAIAGNTSAQINHQISVNGVQQAIAQVPNNAVVGAGVAMVTTAMVNLNGTTDYITTSCYTTVAGQTCVGSTSTMLLVRWIST